LVDIDKSDPHSLIPLKLAAELVWNRFYESRASAPVWREPMLNSIAATISAMGDIYEYSPTDSKSSVRVLSRIEMEGGVFKHGGDELHFIDGRPSRYSLAVRAELVSATIEVLTRAAS
jgi:hypothetical protein